MTPSVEQPTAPETKSSATGKHGMLRMTFEPRGERTVVVDQFWRVPLQVMPPSYQDQDGQAFLYVLNPTGGIVQGDRLEVDIVLRAGAKVLVTTQSATKVYRMEEDCAWEINRFVVEAGGLLEYLPDQTIPYAAASFRRTTHVDAHPSATVLVGDILSAGRVARGEAFEFTRLETELCIATDGVVRVLDRLDLRPAMRPLETLGVWEDHHHYASLYVVGPGVEDGFAGRVAAFLESQQHVLGSASAPEEGLLVIRMLGRTMLALREVGFQVWDILRRELVGKRARILRKL
jgi:urease accessory protein